MQVVLIPERYQRNQGLNCEQHTSPTRLGSGLAHRELPVANPMRLGADSQIRTEALPLTRRVQYHFAKSAFSKEYHKNGGREGDHPSPPVHPLCR